MKTYKKGKFTNVNILPLIFVKLLIHISLMIIPVLWNFTIFKMAAVDRNTKSVRNILERVLKAVQMLFWGSLVGLGDFL
jgi:hypothetical protein